MEKIKNRVFLLVFLLSMNGCIFKEISDDTNSFKEKPLPKISLKVINTTTKNEVSSPLANGLRELTIQIKADAFIDKDKRTVTISTNNGNFAINGEFVKKADLPLNDNLSNEVTFVSPREASSVVIELRSSDGTVTDRKELTFEPAYPDNIKLEIPHAQINDSTTISVKALLSRSTGMVSTHLEFKYQLLDGTGNEVKNATFFERTDSDSNQTSTAKLQVDRVLVGTYKVKVSVIKNGVPDEASSGNKEIEVVD